MSPMFNSEMYCIRLGGHAISPGVHNWKIPVAKISLYIYTLLTVLPILLLLITIRLILHGSDISKCTNQTWDMKKWFKKKWHCILLHTPTFGTPPPKKGWVIIGMLTLHISYHVHIGHVRIDDFLAFMDTLHALAELVGKISYAFHRSGSLFAMLSWPPEMFSKWTYQAREGHRPNPANSHSSDVM